MATSCCYWVHKCALRLTERNVPLVALLGMYACLSVLFGKKALWYNCAELEGAEGGEQFIRSSLYSFLGGRDRRGAEHPLFQRAEGSIVRCYPQTFLGGSGAAQSLVWAWQLLGRLGLPGKRIAR
jgi:hypothetical protein